MPWSDAGSFAEPRDGLDVSRCSLTPSTFPYYDDRHISIDQNLCAEVLDEDGIVDHQSQVTSAKVKLVEAITTPLGFFVLALLIVEFVLVIGVVSVFVWNKPDNLTFDKEAHLVDRGRIPYGSDEEQVSLQTMRQRSKRKNTNA